MKNISSYREARGKAIADQGNQIKKVNDHLFKVESHFGSGFLDVKSTPNGMTYTANYPSLPDVEGAPAQPARFFARGTPPKDIRKQTHGLRSANLNKLQKQSSFKSVCH